MSASLPRVLWGIQCLGDTLGHVGKGLVHCFFTSVLDASVFLDVIQDIQYDMCLIRTMCAAHCVRE
jgi:hypothetical protein